MRALAENHGPFDDVFKFSDVARPRVGHKGVDRLRRDFRGSLSQPGSAFLREVPSEERDVVGAFSQWRQANRKDAQPVVEVGTKTSGLDGLLEISIGPGDQSDIDPDGLVPADPFELTFLENSEQLGLELRQKITDLIQEESPAVRELEPAGATGQRARESAFLMPEELTFD